MTGEHPSPKGVQLLGRHDRQVDADIPDTGQWRQSRRDTPGDFVTEGATWHSKRHPDRYPAAPYVDPADHAQIDDADVQLRVSDWPQGLDDLVLGERHPFSFGGAGLAATGEGRFALPG
jgi:hypothetical protein